MKYLITYTDSKGENTVVADCVDKRRQMLAELNRRAEKKEVFHIEYAKLYKDGSVGSPITILDERANANG